MKKIKVENISKVKLEFFLKQNKKDIRVMLVPGESSWCDNGTTTKSMILYKRKNLIKIHDEDSTIEKYVDPNNDEVLDKLHTTQDIEYIKIMGVDPPEFTPDTTEDIRTVALDIIPPQSMNPPDAKLFAELNFDSIEKKAQPSIEDYDRILDSLDAKIGVPETEDISFSLLEKAQKETEEYKKESEKTYKGKKRGRKKKRGPKPGSKKKKLNNLPTISENNTDTIITGITGITS